MICRKCRAQLPDGAKICPQCGQSASVIISRHTMPPEQVGRCVSREDIYNVIGKSAEKRVKRELRRRLIAYGIAILIAAALITVWALLIR